MGSIWSRFCQKAKKLITSSFSESSKEPKKPDTVQEAPSFEKKVALFLSKSTRFADLNKEARLLEGNEEALAHLENRLIAREERLKTLVDKRKKLCDQITSLKPEMPAIFQAASESEGYKKKWQQLVDNLHLIAKEDFSVPDQFESENAFNDWIFEKESGIIEGPCHLCPFLCYRVLEKNIQDFRQKQTAVLPFLYKAYVEDFLVEIEKEVLYCNSGSLNACQSHCLSMLGSQQAALFRFDKEVQGEYASLKKKVFPVIEKLYTPELSLYKDLPLRLEQLLKQDFRDCLPEKKVLTADVIVELGKIKEAFFNKLSNDVMDLPELGKKRNEKIEQIELFQKQFSRSLQQLKFSKDLSKERQELEERAKKITLKKQDLLKIPFEKIEKTIDEKYQYYLDFSAQVPEKVINLTQRARELERWCEYGKQTIKRRLFEVFFNITPYKELEEDLSIARSRLTRQLTQLVDRFYEGDLLVDEYLAACQEMAYEHDVVKLRNEISYRGTRLKDIRSEVVSLSKSLSEERRLLFLVPGVSKGDLYSEVVTAIQEVFSLFQKVENPFRLFAKATSKDETNHIFRSIWIEIEKLQLRAEQLKQKGDILLKANTEVIKSAFFRVTEYIEEVVYQKEGTRPVLGEQIKKDLIYNHVSDFWTFLTEKNQHVEKRFPFSQPLSFFLQISDSNLCVELLKRAQKLEERVSEIYLFAKEMQYIKTFDEEYVDVILEVFERHHLLEETSSDSQAIKKAWEIYEERIYHACSLVEEEIILDIGLLDMRALMDVDQKNLQKTLSFAIGRAKKHIPDVVKRMQIAKKNGSPEAKLCQGIYQDICTGIENWDRAEDETPKKQLEKLKLFCYYLFSASVSIAAARKQRLAKILVLVGELRLFCLLLEQWLQKKREAGLEWSRSWSVECFNLRREIERFEPQEESIDTLRAFVVKIFSMTTQIPEIAQAKQNVFEEMMNEIKQHLIDIEEAFLNEEDQMPFFYIPGYLHFFMPVRETYERSV